MTRWRSVSCFVLLSLLSLLPPALAQDQPDHESELTDTSFPPLELEPHIFLFPNEDFVRIALKIQLGTASIQERRWWYRAAERYAPFQGAPAPDWSLQAARQAARLDPAIRSRTAASSSSTVFNWAAVGPNGDYDVSGVWGPPGARDQGRSTAVWTHLEGASVVNKNIIFLGFADGGVWKSTDGGARWTPLTDFQPTLSIGALDVLPGQDLVNYSDATIYVGTGEGNFSAVDKDGVGVLKSTDGGATWTVQTIPWRGDVLGQAGLHRIRRIRIDRNVPNGQSVWVAGDGGVYHTADGGGSWSLVTGLPYSSAPAGSAFPGGCWAEYATDFAVDTADRPNGHSTLLAVFGRVQDATCATPASDARKNNGVYRSVDGGATWSKITVSGVNGFPAIPGNVGRITLLSAPSNPKHVYLLIARADNFQSLGIFDTLDVTADPVIWTPGSTTNFVASQGWYNITGAVDPTNENRLIVGGLDNWLSNDRGATITEISGWSASDDSWAHADHHHAVWVDANTYYDANDGGLNIGHIDGDDVTWTHRNAGSLATLQFYGIGQSATDPYRINAGLQDNGHALLMNGQWQATFGGDGGFAAIDQTNHNEAYEEYVYGSIRNSDDGGQTWPTTGCMQTFGVAPPCTGCLGLCVPDNHTAFIANFMLDVHNQNVMYVGTNWIYRNPDARSAGKVWTRLTTDGINGDFVYGSTSATAYVSIIHTPQASPVAGIPAVSQILYAGTSHGRIWKSTNGGATWTDLTKPPLPANSLTTGRYLTWIDTDPSDANKIVVTYSGWSNSTNPPIPGHVFRSVDGGATWTDISGSLPDEPFNAVAVNPNSGATNEIYVASDTGVYVNTDGWNGSSWLRTNSGLLPHVSVNMLQFTNATTPKRLRAVTHGRGIWELFKECASRVTVDRPAYGCSDTVRISVVEGTRGAGILQVQVTSGAETAPETVTLNEFPAGSGNYSGTVAITGGSVVTGDGRISVFNADTLTVRYLDADPCPGTPPEIFATAVINCSTCGTPASSAAGANLEVDDEPVALAIIGGDGDEFLDNCESGEVTFKVRNIGAGELTNLRVTNVVPSNPAVRPPLLPVVIARSLGQCATETDKITFGAVGLAPGEPLEVRIDVTSDELAARGITRSLTVRYPTSEQDFTFNASKTFTFENDLEGWEVASGTFTRATTGGGAQLSSHYLASSSLLDGACDEIRSPVVKLSPTSTLSLYNQFAIEPLTDTWYDRANLGLYDLSTGQRTNVAPSGGRTYLASGPNGVCAAGGQPGWAGPGPGWLESTWTSSDLQAAAFAGRKVQLDVAYGTDSTASLTGFWLDHVTLTDFEQQGDDLQGEVCTESCGNLDDTHPAIEYRGGWHRRSDPNASNGGYHRRSGINPRGAEARVVFHGTGITYFYGVASGGGTADLYVDGVYRQTVSYAGPVVPSFGRSVTFSNLGPGAHELRIVHVSGLVTVDGFHIDCASGQADATAVEFRSITQTSTGSAAEGPILSRTVEVGPEDREVSVVVEGSALPLTVRLIDPTGDLIASGGALLAGSGLSGLDAVVTAPGTYTVQVVNTLTPGKTVGISIARTVETQ